jgi:hypothetical protein
MARFVGRQDDDIRFALGVIDDHRRLIAAGKTHRWDMVKWAVTVNMALAGASVTLRAADDISQAKREGCRAHCRGRDALSRRNDIVLRRPSLFLYATSQLARSMLLAQALQNI